MQRYFFYTCTCVNLLQPTHYDVLVDLIFIELYDPNLSFPCVQIDAFYRCIEATWKWNQKLSQTHTSFFWYLLIGVYFFNIYIWVIHACIINLLIVNLIITSNYSIHMHELSPAKSKANFKCFMNNYSAANLFLSPSVFLSRSVCLSLSFSLSFCLSLSLSLTTINVSFYGSIDYYSSVVCISYVGI